MDYIVQGRTKEGETVYYTGKAGAGFVSSVYGEAFTYSTLERARKRATMLNVGRDVHEIHFMVPVGEAA